MENQKAIEEGILASYKRLNLSLDPRLITLEASKDSKHGDYASNIVLKTAKMYGFKPLELATKVADNFSSDVVERLEVAGPGFLNFFLKKSSLADVMKKILEEGEHFGDGKKKNYTINVEFVSANPTGDLHLGHTRGAVLGDTISNIYEKAGYQVIREYYLNDCGNQVRHLGLSLQARYRELFGYPLELGDDDYHGVDLIAIAEKIKEEKGDELLEQNEENLKWFMARGIQEEFQKIQNDLSDFGVRYDVYSRESEIRASGLIEKILAEFKAKGYTYEKDGALYLKTTSFLDDKDRPLVKSDGVYTYFLPDIAYHYSKKKRGADLLVDLLGADHHGYINRLKSALMMLGESQDSLAVDIYQLVRVYRDGQEVKMSKRTGKAITHRELVEEVGKDAVRYLFVERASGIHVDFDIDLAVKKSKDNPLYYAEYAHARCASLLELGKEYQLNVDGNLLNTEKEAKILKHLASFPEIIENSALQRAPWKLASYLDELARLMHEYYAANKIIDSVKKELTGARLALIKAIKIVLKEGFRLLGVNAYEKM